MDKDKIVILFDKYISNQATVSEVEELLNYIQSNGPDDYVANLIEQCMFNQPEPGQDTAREKRLAETHSILLEHITKDHPVKERKLQLWKYIVTAASLLLLSILGVYVYKLLQGRPSKQQQLTINAKDVAPGTNKAVLVLADGKRINLNDSKVGDITSEAGTLIKKSGDGQLEYTTLEKQTVSNKLNAIETPNGGQYQVRLPDGTKVWLNAASKISYPVSFIGSDKRIVTLSGEAYFEVYKDKQQPFIVKSKEQEVTVLGTHFNVNSYPDENKTVTTLAEGSVRVSAFSKEQLIKPGQQVVKTAQGLAVENGDLATTLAWKDGLFNFNKADIRSIMPQIARWYDVDVFYSGEVSKELVTGDISRQSNLSTVLKILELAHIRFQMEMRNGRKTLIISQ